MSQLAAGSFSPSSSSSSRGGSPSRRNQAPMMPSYNEFTNSPSVAAGVPVLELVRKFEEEKLLSREDRIALNDGLYNPERREGIVKALRDLELGDGSRFAVRRLKALIYQNGTGEVTSSMYKQQQQQQQQQQAAASKLKQQSRSSAAEDALDGQKPAQQQASSSSSSEPQEQQPPPSRPKLTVDTSSSISDSQQQQPTSSSAGPRSTGAGASSPKTKSSNGSPGRRHQHSQQDDERSVASSRCDTQNAIVQAVGLSPVYWGPDNFHITHKITMRLRDFLVKMKMAPSQGKRKFAVLVGEGSMNPLTRMHLRAYFVAKQYLEGQAGFIVLGSLLSPSHGMTVRERYRTHPQEIMPPPHRLAIAQMMVQESKWLSIDPWGITRRRPMDYLSLLQHTRDTLADYFPGVDIKLLYLCKHNAVPLLSQSTLRAENFGVVCPCRATEYDSLKRSMGSKWNGVMWLVEDTAVLDASMDVITSRRVRDGIRGYRGIENLVGTAIDLYVQQNRIGAKMNGEEEWTEDEKKLPVCASRPLNFTLKSQYNVNSSLSGTSGTSNAGFTPGATPYTPSWQSRAFPSPSPFSAPAGTDESSNTRALPALPEVEGDGPARAEQQEQEQLQEEILLGAEPQQLQESAAVN